MNPAYWAARTVLATLAHTPRPAADWLARRYTHLLDIAIPRLRRVGYSNLDMTLPGADRKAIIDGVFHSVARILVAFSRFPRLNQQNIGQWIRYEGFEHFEEARRRGKGVLFATAHLGNWELSAFAHALMARPMNVVVRPLDNTRIDGIVETYRTLSGNTLIEKKEAARSILKALAQNEAVGILIDQNASLDQGVFVDFFGVPACANVAFAKIAARSGAAVIPGFALWSESERKYVLRFYPIVEMTGNAAADTAAIQGQLERVIREYPDQWLWIHRRWKTRPPTEGGN
ncbi:MAG: lysophospholipid acyltransferase family protein [Bryobacteraceae bacterium]